jgi:cobyrinic acid a,c-diamide synthase
VLGSLPDEPVLAVPERHLGLVPAAEGGVSASTLDRLADLVTQRFDMAAIRRIAESAGPLSDVASADLDALPPEVRIGVAQDRAFGFYYQHAIDVLRECGAEIVPFSPLLDEKLPTNTDGLYLGGGFPELYAPEWARNDGLRAALQEHARQSRPIYAECGGLMALGRSLTTFEGQTLPMFGLLPLDSRMQCEQLTIGYREVTALRPSLLMEADRRVRGHEFRARRGVAKEGVVR